MCARLGLRVPPGKRPFARWQRQLLFQFHPLYCVPRRLVDYILSSTNVRMVGVSLPYPSIIEGSDATNIYGNIVRDTIPRVDFAARVASSRCPTRAGVLPVLLVGGCRKIL